MAAKTETEVRVEAELLTDPELWQMYWREFYSLKQEVRKVNLKLVEVKMRLRSQGLPYGRPPPPQTGRIGGDLSDDRPFLRLLTRAQKKDRFR